MWSRHASVDLSGIALGVGHFTVPPDASVDDRGHAPDVSESHSTIRTIVVPHDIVAVPRRSPVRPRKRTPWHPLPDGHGIIERGGSREWLTDRVFVESKQTNLPAACSTSLLVHVSLVILVALLLAARAARLDATPLTHQRVSLQMPAMLSLMPAVVAPPPKGNAVEPPTPAPAMSHPAPQAAATLGSPAAAPLEMPSGVDAEPAMHDDAAIDDAAVGTEAGGETNGVARGDASAGGGPAVEAAPPPAATGPYQIGDGIDRPRKIKDVKPVYPLPAMAAQVGGAVYIEATIGADGKVRDARVLRSVAILEQAALDAVRQWEYEPSRRNGVAVAVTMVVVVTFALL